MMHTQMVPFYSTCDAASFPFNAICEKCTEDEIKYFSQAKFSIEVSNDRKFKPHNWLEDMKNLSKFFNTNVVCRLQITFLYPSESVRI